MEFCAAGEMHTRADFVQIIPHCRPSMKTALTVLILFLPLCVGAQGTAPRSKAIVGAAVVILCGDHPAYDAVVVSFAT
jgi:hypothetical protein